MTKLGLIQDGDRGWIYSAGNAVVTRHGIEKRASGDITLPWLQIDSRCCDQRVVSDFYTELLSFEKNDPRSTGLIAAVTSAWLSIFAELIKSEHFQIPAVVYIGGKQSGKTSFTEATTLLRPADGNTKMTVFSGKKKDARQVTEYCRGGQIIISDLRQEGTRSRGTTAEILDEVVRSVSEMSNTPGAAVITAELALLQNKELIPSLKERLLWVPLDGLMDSEESNQWLLDLGKRCLVGNLLTTVLPSLLDKMNTVFPLSKNQWELEFTEQFKEYRSVHFTSGHQREENTRFLIQYAHEEILDAALARGLISQQLHGKAMERVVETADWFFNRQLMIADSLGKEVVQLILKQCCDCVRYVEKRLICVRHRGVFPHRCYDCTHLKKNEEQTWCAAELAQHQFDDAELQLRSDELGIAFDTSNLEKPPAHVSAESLLMIVRRNAFFEALDDIAFEVGNELYIELPELTHTAWMQRLREHGILAYKVRDGERKQYDYAIKWPTCVNYPHGRQHSIGTPCSCLVLQIPASFKDSMFTSCDETKMMFDEPEIDLEQILARFRFKRIHKQ